ncbi:MAG: sulfur carrier protein ThiS [Phycisphaerae bacterium]|jgi:thiamine biosynthesis protein ThiS
MQIHVNGQPRQESDPLSLAALLERLSLESRRVAVELNRQIVPRARYGSTQLAEGDQLEIVTLVGGG